MQYDRNRCEMVGCHWKLRYHMFGVHCYDETNRYNGHVEAIYKARTSLYEPQGGGEGDCHVHVIVCPRFVIERTQRGGVDMVFEDI